MSFLLGVIGPELIKLLEAALESAEPNMEAQVLAELHDLLNGGLTYIEDKMTKAIAATPPAAAV